MKLITYTFTDTALKYVMIMNSFYLCLYNKMLMWCFKNMVINKDFRLFEISEIKHLCKITTLVKAYKEYLELC